MQSGRDQFHEEGALPPRRHRQPSKTQALKGGRIMNSFESSNEHRDITALFTLEIDGGKADGRSQAARVFKRTAGDLMDQLARTPKPSEGILLRNAATLAFLCDRDTARLMAGQAIDEENYRRNAQALGGVLIKLGMAAKSRDVTKGASKGGDPFADAINATWNAKD